VVRNPEKVLFVDDEPRVLSALRRRLFGRFAMLTASRPGEALHILETTSGIAVVVADMRMPEMSGIELLTRVRERWPDIRRIMLTGNTDQETAIAAVNNGKVFRFFCKPVDADLLADALESAIEEYRFATDSKAELRDLQVLAASAERTRKSFLAMMNHELRTPLNHILGFSALLEQRCKQKGETEALEYLAYIRESGLSLLHTLNRILEIVRLTAGDSMTDLAIIDLTQLIREEVRRFRPLAATRGVTIGFDAPAETLCVEASEHDLAQAIAELLDNAIKFNRPEGHVSVAVHWTHQELAIRVADTGIGMAEADVNRVLNAFSQRDDGLNRRFEGIGVGLTLAALTAQAYGGSVGIESRKDHGTVALMRLKRAISTAQAVKIAG
jgi:signal transduction histidine kinase